MILAPTAIRTAPTLGPIFPVPADGADIVTYVELFRANDPNTKAVVIALIGVISDAAADPIDSPQRVNARRCFFPGAYAAINVLREAVPIDPDHPTDSEIIIANAISNGPAAIGWFQDLVNAGKKKVLEPGNVEGYFASLDFDGITAPPVCSLINKAKAFFPDQIMFQNFRDSLSTGVWTSYRVSRTSAGHILHDLIPAFRDMGILKPGDEADIEASHLAPWDPALNAAIRNDLKAYGYIYHEVCGTTIDKWIQGSRCADQMPSVKVRNAKAAMRIYLDLKNDVGSPDLYATVASLTEVGSRFAAIW